MLDGAVHAMIIQEDAMTWAYRARAAGHCQGCAGPSAHVPCYQSNGKARDAAYVCADRRMDDFGWGPMGGMGPPLMRDEGPDGMAGMGDHGPPMMHHGLPGTQTGALTKPEEL